MSRPLRLEFPNAIYHVTSRGDRREPIYRSDQDRLDHLEVIAQAMERFDAQVLAYCLMGNHYHLVLHTRQANLSRLMRHINGVYTQNFNRRHALVGHLFQGRFKAILVDRDAYLLTLCRYVERNPVAAGLVAAAGDWGWSSYQAHAGLTPTPQWLDTVGLHGYLLGAAPASAADHRRAAKLYVELVARHVTAPLWAGGLTAQVFLGDAEFAARMQALATAAQSASPDIPSAQRTTPLSWLECLQRCAGQRDAALHLAYTSGGHSMTELAKLLGLSVSRVSRLIAAVEKDLPAGARQAKGKT
jgi:REP element-mobilizing transposase RayT